MQTSCASQASLRLCVPSSARACHSRPVGSTVRWRTVSLGSNAARRPRTLVCKAEGDRNSVAHRTANRAKEDKFKESLQRGGIDRNTAKKILDIWQQAGINDPDKLRQILTNRSLGVVLTALFQLLIDGGAAASSYSLGLEWLADNTFGGATPIASALVFTLAGYFAAGAFFDLFTVGAVSVASLEFRRNSTLFLQAMKEIAGPTTGSSPLNVVDKAATAADMVKVIDALGKIQDALKEDAKVGRNGKANTLSDLTAYMVLDNAEKRFGFQASKYGLTDSQAADIAFEYGKWDTNGDGQLDLKEFEQMVSALDMELEEPEKNAAFSLIDADGNGYISFVEFVEWWMEKKKDKVAA